jgi:xanthine dehydrogenase small subunit
MGDPIRLLVNGAPVEIRDARPTMTLLDWLRERRRLTGTKEGCNEGDCGACTVAVRRLEGDRVVTRPVNACIQLLPMLHGAEVVTVEGIAGPGGAPHPVQAAMADLHGSQCGFCTPGFVMSLWAARISEGPPDRARIDDLLAGNLCRCTGYGPIIAAARAAWEAPLPAWPADDEPAAAARLRALGAAGHLAYEAEGRRFLAPTDLDAFADLVAAHPEATILGGATDVGLWVTKRFFDPATVVWTGRVAALREIREEGGALVIGAAATYGETEARIAAHYPDMGELIRRIGSAQVRAAGTVGGNVANGSPIGDMPPALIAAGATLRLRRGRERRETPLEAFFLDYGRQDRRPGEFVEALVLPLPAERGRLRCHKVSKRFDQDITAVCGCFDVAVEGGVATAARLAYGGMAGVPKRAAAAEAALVGRPWTAATVENAAAALEADFTPLSDMRASAAYRLTVAKNLLRRHFIETTQPAVATRLARPAA